MLNACFSFDSITRLNHGMRVPLCSQVSFLAMALNARGYHSPSDGPTSEAASLQQPATADHRSHKADKLNRFLMVFHPPPLDSRRI